MQLAEQSIGAIYLHNFVLFSIIFPSTISQGLARWSSWRQSKRLCLLEDIIQAGISVNTLEQTVRANTCRLNKTATFAHTGLKEHALFRDRDECHTVS